MNKKILTSLFLLVSITFFSCQKELSIDTSGSNGNNNNNNNNPTSIVGNWSWINLYMKFSSSASTNENGVEIKMVSTCETTSINNKGEMSFEADKFTATNMGYSIDDTIYVNTYIMGSSQGEEKFEFGGDVPPYSASGKYQKIGNDSLYFPDGSAFQGLVVDGQPITSSAASGAKYIIKSDTLLVYQDVNITKDTIINIGGVQNVKFRIDQKATTIGSFKKK